MGSVPIDLVDKAAEVCYFIMCATEVEHHKLPELENSRWWLLSLLLTYLYANGGNMLWNALSGKSNVPGLHDVPVVALCWYLVYRLKVAGRLSELPVLKVALSTAAAWSCGCGIVRKVQDELLSNPEAFVASVVGGGMVGTGGVLYINLAENLAGKKRMSVLGKPSVGFRKGYYMALAYAAAIFSSWPDAEVENFCWYLVMLYTLHEGLETALEREVDFLAPFEFLLRIVLRLDVTAYKSWYSPTPDRRKARSQ